MKAAQRVFIFALLLTCGWCAIKVLDFSSPQVLENYNKAPETRLSVTPWGAPIVWEHTLAKSLEYSKCLVPQEPHIGLVVVALGKYTIYASKLFKTADEYFLKNRNVTYFIFTDQVLEIQKLQTSRKIVIFEEENLGWPKNSMMRLIMMNRRINELLAVDFLYSCDVDMIFRNEFGDEILDELVATLHPGFYNKRRDLFTYETTPNSSAYVAPTEGEYYFAGGLFGGRANRVFHMTLRNEKNINQDLNHNFTAIWHDESHLNRFMIDYPPTKILSPEYCWPEEIPTSFKTKLLAISKNHAAMRSDDH